MPDDMEKFTIRLPAISLEKLEAKARAEGIPTATYARRVLERDLESPSRNDVMSKEEIERICEDLIDKHIERTLTAPVLAEALAIALEMDRGALNREIRGIMDEYMKAAHSELPPGCVEAMLRKKKD